MNFLFNKYAEVHNLVSCRFQFPLIACLAVGKIPASRNMPKHDCRKGQKPGMFWEWEMISLK